MEEFKSYSLLSDDIEEEKMLRAELRKFNWGAFGFSWIWGACNGVFHKVFVAFVLWIVAIFLPFLSGIAGLGIIGYSIYFGINGNRWIYNEKHIADVQKFIKGQRKWAAAFVIILGLCVSFWLLTVLSLLVSGFNPFTSSGRAEMILKPLVDTIVNSNKYSSFKDGTDVAAYMLEDSHNSSSTSKFEPYGVYGVKVTRDSSSANMAFTFYKEDNCDIAKKNCYVYYYENMAGGPLVPISKAYYSDSGDMKIVKIKKKK